MLVKKFMLPLGEVLSVEPEATVKTVLDKMMANIHHSAVVVTTGDLHVPVGIVTKADMLKAYHEGLVPEQHKIKEVMSKTIETVLDTDTRDAAAKHFEVTKHKNAFVVNKQNHFVGLVSALDVAIEVSRDEHAWPWNREALDNKYKVPGSPKSTMKGPAAAPLHTFEQISGAGDN
jgi:CBS domain-containing protein